MEGDDGTAMITGDMPDILYGTGVLDDTVIRTAVRTQSLRKYPSIVLKYCLIEVKIMK